MRRTQMSLKVIEQQNPMGRVSSLEEDRGTAVFMLSDASSFITGSDLVIDGGISLLVRPYLILGHRVW